MLWINRTFNRNNKLVHSICSSPCLDLIVIFGMFLFYLNSCMIFQLFGLFVLIEQWLRSLCILWSWAEYLDHLPRQLIPLCSNSTSMVLVLVLVLYIGLVYCVLGLGQSIWTTWPGSWPHFGLIVLWWSPARPPLHFHIRTNAISAGKQKCGKSAIHWWRNNSLIFVCHSRKII